MAFRLDQPPKQPGTSRFDRGDGDDNRPRIPNLRIGRWIVIGFLALVLGVGALSAAYTVQPEERVVVKRFGAIVRSSEPGLHFRIPYGIETIERVPTERILKQEFGFRTVGTNQRSEYDEQGDYTHESLILTGDLNVINVEWVVQYRISDPEKYLFRGLREPEDTLRDIAEAAMQRVIGNRLGSEALTEGRTEIAYAVQQDVQTIMDTYDSGMTILRVELQDVVPPREVRASFNEVNEARQERERMINEAERARNQVVPRAQGEARQIVSQSEGYALERVNRAKGEAVRFLELLSAYSESPDVTRRRLYLETIDRVLPRAGAVYITEEGQTSPIPLLNMNHPSAEVK